MAKLNYTEKYKKQFLIAAGTLLFLGFFWQSYFTIPATGVKTEFTIIAGESLDEISSNLAKNGLIKNKYVFKLFTILTGQEKNFKAGQYSIEYGLNLPQLVNIFSGGKYVRGGVMVVVPEGTNVSGISELLKNTGLTAGEDFLKKNLAEEGFLFPDTYYFQETDSAEVIASRMRANFQQKWKENFPELSAADLRKTVIVASLLEKEVPSERDMRLVAGIIEKRISLEMPLEIDAAIAYGACWEKFRIGTACEVSRANIVDNLSRPSVYNVYKQLGLPAGPITNPGLKAIAAALNPLASDYLYYLSARDGTTIFSKTGSEHLAARQKYLGF